jgi:hypothetical protein
MTNDTNEPAAPPMTIPSKRDLLRRLEERGDPIIDQVSEDLRRTCTAAWHDPLYDREATLDRDEEIRA